MRWACYRRSHGKRSCILQCLGWKNSKSCKRRASLQTEFWIKNEGVSYKFNNTQRYAFPMQNCRNFHDRFGAKQTKKKLRNSSRLASAHVSCKCSWIFIGKGWRTEFIYYIIFYWKSVWFISIQNDIRSIFVFDVSQRDIESNFILIRLCDHARSVNKSQFKKQNEYLKWTCTRNASCRLNMFNIHQKRKVSLERHRKSGAPQTISTYRNVCFNKNKSSALSVLIFR